MEEFAQDRHRDCPCSHALSKAIFSLQLGHPTPSWLGVNFLSVAFA